MMARVQILYQTVIFSGIFINYGVEAHAVYTKPVRASPVSIEAVPFVAALVSRRPRCAASVVHERFLLTAASCFIDGLGRPINLTKALVGTDNLANGGQLYAIKTTIPHKKYSIHTGDYNVGLVKLAERIAFGPKVGPIKLGKKAVVVGDLVSVVGWGTGKKPPSARRLYELSVPVLQKEECQQGLLGRIIAPRMLCAGVDGVKQGDCVGDEGGPVFANKTLVAVVSPSTCGGLPGLYTRVSAVRRWITTTIDENYY